MTTLYELKAMSAAMTRRIGEVLPDVDESNIDEWIRKLRAEFPLLDEWTVSGAVTAHWAKREGYTSICL